MTRIRDVEKGVDFKVERKKSLYILNKKDFQNSYADVQRTLRNAF